MEGSWTVLVPATIAFGEVGLGKSQCAEAAQSILGLTSQYRSSKITNARPTKFATLGLIIDDPSMQVRFPKSTWFISKRECVHPLPL